MSLIGKNFNQLVEPHTCESQREESEPEELIAITSSNDTMKNVNVLLGGILFYPTPLIYSNDTRKDHIPSTVASNILCILRGPLCSVDMFASFNLSISKFFLFYNPCFYILNMLSPSPPSPRIGVGHAASRKSISLFEIDDK